MLYCCFLQFCLAVCLCCCKFAMDVLNTLLWEIFYVSCLSFHFIGRMPKGAGYRRPDVAEEAGGLRLLIPWVFSVRTYLHCNWGWSGANNGFFSENFLCTNRPLEFDSP